MNTYWLACAGMFALFTFIGTTRRVILYVLFTALAFILTVLYGEWLYQGIVYPALLNADAVTLRAFTGYWWVIPDVFFGLLVVSVFILLHMVYQVLWRPRRITNTAGPGWRLLQAAIGGVCGFLLFAAILLSSYSVQYLVDRSSLSGRTGGSWSRELRDPALIQAMQTTADGLDSVLRPWSVDEAFVLISPAIGAEFGLFVRSAPPQ